MYKRQALAVTFIVFACGQVSFGEFIPKAMAVRHPDRAALATVPLLHFFYTVFKLSLIHIYEAFRVVLVVQFLMAALHRGDFFGIQGLRGTASGVHDVALVKL